MRNPRGTSTHFILSGFREIMQGSIKQWGRVWNVGQWRISSQIGWASEYRQVDIRGGPRTARRGAFPVIRDHERGDRGITKRVPAESVCPSARGEPGARGGVRANRSRGAANPVKGCPAAAAVSQPAMHYAPSINCVISLRAGSNDDFPLRKLEVLAPRESKLATTGLPRGTIYRARAARVRGSS